MASKSFLETGPITIGIDDDHNFFAQFSNGVMVSITQEVGVYLLRLLSIDFQSFRKEINALIEKSRIYEGKKEVSPQEFPYAIIVKTALASERDHWIELSIPWLMQIGKENFVKEIKDIQNNKKVSQRVRHLLLKL